MADKEATVFILDLGQTMGRIRSGRSESDLDYALRYVWNKITHIVSMNRKTLCVGVLGLRTDETSNTMEGEDGYENISVLHSLGQITTNSMKALQPKITPSQTLGGDAISAIIVAVDMIDTFTKKLKWERKIVLVTDGEGPMDANADDILATAQKMNDSKISLTVLGVDFDDAEYGPKEEDKTKTKAENETVLRSLSQQVDNGIFSTLAEAVDDSEIPRVKAVRPFKTYDGPLTLGDPSKYPTAISINVERYTKTKQAKPMTASTVVVKSEMGGSQSTQTMEGDAADGAGFSAVKSSRSYRVNDPDAPGGKRDVEFESLAKGYEYGRTAVHISESEHNITKLETDKGFTIVGFIEWDKYQPFLNMGEACVTHARKYDVKSAMALSAFIWSLYENETYAVARIVTKEGKEPMLVIMAPEIEPGFECLYDVPLPFAEDVRSYQFPPLDRVVTVSGQTLDKHRFLPSDELNNAMSDLVDAMDLSTYGIDEEGNPAEYITTDESYNPSIHRLNAAVAQRAVYPDKPVPETPEILTRFSTPSGDLMDKVKAQVERLIEVADVKKVPPKAKGKRGREAVKPISGLDIDALLGTSSSSTISADNAIPDYKRALQSATEIPEIAEATKQMGNIVKSLITDSFGDRKYDQAAEAVGVMREELINMEEPGLYNSFARELKKGLLTGALGGDRREFWFKMRWGRLGLIDDRTSEVSDVTVEQADEFYKTR